MDRIFDYSKWLGWLVILLMTSHCSTAGKGVLSEDHLRPLHDIRKAVYSAYKGYVKRKSQNGRTYYSEYHKPGNNLSRSAYKQNERAQLTVSILGDRRPYRIKVEYKIFKLNGGKYSAGRYDKKLARHYLNVIEDYLASRPEERDIIDDYRPY